MAFRSVNTSSGGSNSSIVANAPAGIASGDILLAQIAFTSSSGSWAPPSGWTLIDTASPAGNTNKIYWKLATGSEPSTYTWTITGATGFWATTVTAYSGRDNVTPINAHNFNSNSTGTTIGTNAVTTTVNNCDVCTGFLDDSGGSTWTEGVGTERSDANGLAWADSVQSTAGSFTSVTGTASSSGTAKGAFIVALAPAAGGSGLPFFMQIDEMNGGTDALGGGML